MGILSSEAVEIVIYTCDGRAPSSLIKFSISAAPKTKP
jgi:hypothetical protein